MEQMNNGSMGSGMCKCPHHKTTPVLIVLFGLLFLLGALDVFTSEFVAVTWPILVILGGLSKLTSGMCKCCSGRWM